MARYSNYRSPRTPPPERRTLFMVTVFALFLIVTDLITGGMIRGVVHAGGAVFSGAADRTGATLLLLDPLATRAALQTHVDELEKELAAYKAEDGAYTSIKAENSQLKAMAHLAESEPGITAPVLLSYSASPYGTFMIGAGSAEGVHDGSIVRTSDGYAIGSVAETDSHTSIVKEFLAPGEKIEAMIGTAAITLEGSGGGNARGQAAREAVIKVGDTAVLAGTGGLSVGIVGKVVADPANSFTQVYVRIPQNLATLRFIYVQSGRK